MAEVDEQTEDEQPEEDVDDLEGVEQRRSEAPAFHVDGGHAQPREAGAVLGAAEGVVAVEAAAVRVHDGLRGNQRVGGFICQIIILLIIFIFTLIQVEKVT